MKIPVGDSTGTAAAMITAPTVTVRPTRVRMIRSWRLSLTVTGQLLE